MKSKSEVLAVLKENTVSFATVSGIVTTRTGTIKRIDRGIPEFSDHCNPILLSLLF